MKSSTSELICLLFITCIHIASSARILGVFFYPGKSHFLVALPLLEELAQRGHEVDVVSFFPRSTPLANYKDISIEGAIPLKTNNYSMDVWTTMDWKTVRRENIWNGGVAVCDKIFQHEHVQNLIHSNTKYDLLLTEIFGSECQLGFSYKFQVPTVVIFSSKPFSWNTDPLGSPEHPAFVSSTQFAYPDKMSFFQRLINTLYWVDVRIGFWYYSQIPSDTVARKYFGNSMPPLGDIAKNTSLLLVNQHFSLNRAKPHVPAVIEVGGIHIQKLKPLPEELDRWLNESGDGVVYFSMGSMLRADTFPADKVAALLDAFREIPHRVLWKWEGDSLPGQPENVRIGKWLPQRDILNHPKVKVFITHGGLLGTMEAIESGVPMVGIPVFGDQQYNMRCYVSDGVAEQIEYKEITKERVLSTLRKVLYDPSYATNTRRYSRIFRDRPRSALDEATYWTEYVIRHRGAAHLRSGAATLPWYQYLLLDVIAFLVAASAAALGALYYLLKKLLGVCMPKKKKSKQN